jgi:hypothetical protein
MKENNMELDMTEVAVNGTPMTPPTPVKKQKKVMNTSVVTNITFSDGSTLKSFRETFEGKTLTEIDQLADKRAAELGVARKHVDVYSSYREDEALQANVTFQEGSYYE